MLHPSDTRVKGNLKKIREKLKDKNIVIYFYPSVTLRQEISNGTNLLLQKMPKTFVSVLLEGKGIIIAKSMLYSYLAGTLDEKNSFILNNGEIRILGTTTTIDKIL